MQNAANNLILLHPEPAGFQQNPALFSTGVQTGVTYFFNISSIPYYCFDLNSRIYKENFSLSLASLGSETYQENRASLGYNYTHKNVAAGVNLRFLQTKITNYDEATAYAVDIGLGWEINSFTSYFSFKNITGNNYKKSKLPVVITWESSWSPTEESKLSIGLEKEDDFDFCYRMGAAYRVLETLKLICSYQHQPERLGAGFVVEYQKWEISYGIRSHRYLSLTHYISLCYAF
ncbi:MAG: hypothetical protein PWQ09_1259 [Candidatus Cloacimonadota bacterium]|nr:hypothetical protein [Candidatus Cloacimonadota bacterium]